MYISDDFISWKCEILQNRHPNDVIYMYLTKRKLIRAYGSRAT